ncbi:pyruvate carboxylase [Apiospora arundinis]
MAQTTYALKTAADRRPPQAKPAKKKGPNGPRLDPYMRLINRFYEPLRLLHVLGQTRGKHTAVPKCADPIQKSRRRLLENLAYLVVFGKGGKTPPVAAIGLEGVETGYVFWLASNHLDDLDKMEPFLSSMIENVRRHLNHPPGFTEAQFIEQCITFAAPRIEREKDLLERFIKCVMDKSIQRPYSDVDRALVQWLERFRGKSLLELCYLAYEQRKSEYMKLITRRGHPLEDESHQSESVQRYVCLRHVIGRLASHIRAPRQVLWDALRHRNIFDEGVSTVRRVSAVKGVPRPEPDGLTTPAGILKRMVKPDNPKMKDYQSAMEIMDNHMHIGEKIIQSYESPDFRPSVHCEVQVLEHFYENNLRYSHNDRFIACSKPACYCCHLYFKAHPADPEEPRSHQKIWPSWSPPLVQDGHLDKKKYRHQLNILNTMIESIRKEALNQIEQRVTSKDHHLDSTTGITPSDSADVHSLEERLTSMNLGNPGTDDEGGGSDSSFSSQSMSSGSAHSFHETSATDTAPEEEDEQRLWASSAPYADESHAAVDDGAIDTSSSPTIDPTGYSRPGSDEDDDSEVEGGAAL